MNHDGYPDIYLTNLATIRPDGQPNINRVFVNRAGSGFSEKTTIATGARGAQCVAKGDINQDGWDDLLVCYEKGIGHLYLNNKHGDFDELMSPALSGEWRMAKLADMNDDGLDDLVLITDTSVFQIWLNTGKGKYFESPSFERQLPGTGAALAVGDFNHDGYKDVYVALDDAECRTSGHDLAPDIIYYGQRGGGWRKGNLTQDYYGCGHLVDVLDGHKILLENGGIEYRGPNYIIDWPK
jgi:FG-GAP-like repeat